jgi:glycosyltransferase involved in cell wall biosynthesis
VEKYIKRCLDSVFDQKVSKSEYEVIVVNDGTQDGSMSIVKQYEKYENLIVLTQENKGLSGARNSGLRIAKGEYVWFVDSDDYIDKKSIDVILDVIEKANANVYAFPHRKVYEKYGSMEPEMKGLKEGLVMMEDFSVSSLCTSCVPFYVLKRSFFIEHNLFFHEGVYHEDMEFLAKLSVCCNEIYVCSSTLYYYLIRESGSIMTSFNIKRSYDCLTIVEELLRFKKENLPEYKKKMKINKSIAFLFILSLINLRDSYECRNKEALRYVSDFSSIVTFRKYWWVFFHHKFTPYVIICMMCIFVSPKLFLFLYPKKDNI